MTAVNDPAAYDSSGAGPVGVLVMSHGTPRSLDELENFYTEIRRGRRPTPEQLADLESRYLAIGGVSPLAERTAAQVAGLARALDDRRPGRFVVFSGTKYSSPRIEEAVESIVRSGARRATGIVLAPHSSVVSVGEYARRAFEAVSASQPGARSGRRDRGQLELTVVDHWYEEPGFVTLLAERLRRATLDSPPSTTEVVFSAHSVPARLIEEGDSYSDQVHESARTIAKEAGIERWLVAWQSAGRSGGEWLGPDLLTELGRIARGGARKVVVCPVGFVSDHLEVLYDLDIEAARYARSAGLEFARTESLNDDPRFCEVLARVVLSADAGN